MSPHPLPAPRSGTRLSREARRSQLLHAARGVFVGQGFHATSMDDVAEAAGVSKPVLYQHFSSKLALYQALAQQSASDLVRLVQEALNSSEDNDTRVYRAVEAYFAFVGDEGQAFRLIFESDLRDHQEIAAIVEQATDSCIAAITDTITADTGTDHVRARLLAAGLVGLSQVSARYWLDQGDGVSPSEAVDLLSALAWRGISHFPRQHNDPPDTAR